MSTDQGVPGKSSVRTAAPERFTIVMNAILRSLASLILMLALPSLAVADSTLQVAATGEGTFAVLGVGVEAAAAFDLVIAYDATTLANPRVSQGPLIAGAMTAVNVNVPGTIRMAIIRTTPINGSGTVATIQFDRTGGSPGRITLFKASLANINGKPIPSIAMVQNPVAPQVPASSEVPAQSQYADTAMKPTVPPSSATTHDPPPSLVILPGTGTASREAASEKKEALRQTDQAAESHREEQRAGEAVTARRSDAPSEPVKGADKKLYTQESVLERFRARTGEPTLKSLTALFEPESLIGFRQDPMIALSDGKSPVTVSFIFMSKGDRAPEIALISARLIAMRKDTENSNTWVAQVLPDRGSPSASLAVAQGEINMVFPLTVAPHAEIDLDRSGRVDEKDAALFLSQRGTSEKVLHDMNGDKKRDFMDDYIFTANYIARRSAMPATVRTP